MRNPITTFSTNLESVKSLHNLHKHLCKLLPAVDLSEILRAEHVLIVSAFDCFVHDVVRCGMLEIFNNNKSPNTKYNDFCIPLSVVDQILKSTSDIEKMDILNLSIKKILAKDSYQSPSSIENALQLLAVKKIWSSVKDDMAMEPNDIVIKLGLIINRRNKIAHEADVSNHIDTNKNQIEREDVEDTFDFLERLAKSIHTHIP